MPASAGDSREVKWDERKKSRNVMKFIEAVEVNQLEALYATPPNDGWDDMFYS